MPVSYYILQFKHVQYVFSVSCIHTKMGGRSVVDNIWIVVLAN